MNPHVLKQKPKTEVAGEEPRVHTWAPVLGRRKPEFKISLGSKEKEKNSKLGEEITAGNMVTTMIVNFINPDLLSSFF